MKKLWRKEAIVAPDSGEVSVESSVELTETTTHDEHVGEMASETLVSDEVESESANSSIQSNEQVTKKKIFGKRMQKNPKKAHDYTTEYIAPPEPVVIEESEQKSKDADDEMAAVLALDNIKVNDSSELTAVELPPPIFDEIQTEQHQQQQPIQEFVDDSVSKTAIITINPHDLDKVIHGEAFLGGLGMISSVDPYVKGYYEDAWSNPPSYGVKSTVDSSSGVYYSPDSYAFVHAHESESLYASVSSANLGEKLAPAVDLSKEAKNLLDSALRLDEEGKSEAAQDAYSDAIRGLLAAIKASKSSEEQTKLRKLADHALNRLEVLKKQPKQQQTAPFGHPPATGYPGQGSMNFDNAVLGNPALNPYFVGTSAEAFVANPDALVTADNSGTGECELCSKRAEAALSCGHQFCAGCVKKVTEMLKKCLECGSPSDSSQIRWLG
uniref:MIT domain-containing protein n=1 Tax=Timspurckia oligopyrenoides TaxID=708627 RepID=A0A7S0ZAM1_9RHOD|mmetsp:Transcript_10292/g.18543  ORF Transcript_10292/g.18543 Transcript_10292/m.18543 type:complete len:440 (+) Transcript_10292:52-1371(+)